MIWHSSINSASTGRESCYEEGSFIHQHPIEQWHEDLQPIVQNRSSNDLSSDRFPCPTCGKVYLRSRSLWRHRNYECGKEPQFQCPYCNHQTKQKSSLKVHILRIHAPKQIGEVNGTFMPDFKKTPNSEHCGSF